LGGAEERHVHDPVYAGVDGRVNEGEVLPDAVGGLGGGNHEHCAGTGQGCSNSGPVAVFGRRDMSAGQGRCLSWIADHEPLLRAELGESTGYPRTETTGRACHGDHGLGSGHHSTASARRSTWSSVATVGSK